MPIDQPEAQAVPNPRRTFLARAAMGGALVAAAGPLSQVLPAGAQDAPTTTSAGSSTGSAAAETLDDTAFLNLAIPLEMATVQVYEAVLSGPDFASFDADATAAVQTFQAHHQTVVDTLTAMRSDTSTALVPSPAVMAKTGSVAGDQATALKGLAELETALAGTHLGAIGAISDPITAKAAAQVLAVEAQQATVLGRLAGTDLATLAPAELATDQSLATAPTTEAGGETTSTTAAGGTTTTQEAGN